MPGWAWLVVGVVGGAAGMLMGIGWLIGDALTRGRIVVR